MHEGKHALVYTVSHNILHSKKMDNFNQPMTYKGVAVSLNPPQMPCMAKERSTAGAPNDLNLKYFSAGFNIGES